MQQHLAYGINAMGTLGGIMYFSGGDMDLPKITMYLIPGLKGRILYQEKISRIKYRRINYADRLS